MRRLFGTDGIRGVANRYPMDGGTAFSVGQAIACLARRLISAPKVVIGRDTRLSGCMLESAAAAGIMSMGGQALLVGVLPTPGVAFVTKALGAQAGVVISASHNPYADNGIKVFSGAGFKLSDEQEEEVEELLFSGELPALAVSPAEMGRSCLVEDAILRYRAFLKSSFPPSLSLKGLRLVLDTANGATFQVAPPVFTELGAEVTVIHDRPDGLNINENCGSEHTEDLRRAVVERGADLGLAFDGDGDRLVAVDEKGVQLTGDQVLLICAYTLKQEGRLKNDLVVSTVMSNLGFHAACRKLGIKNYAAKVGDRYVLEELLRRDGVLGGEESGHVVFLEHHTTGDGILTGLQLVAALLKADKPLSEMAQLMEVYPQRLINVEVKSKPALEEIPGLAEAIAQAEKELGDEGRVLVRYSGTQNLCRVMVEGPTAEVADKHAQEIARVVRTVLG